MNALSPTRRKRPHWPILIAAAVYMAVTYCWIYRGGFGEGDSMSIAAGIFQARLAFSGPFREPLLYMFSFHPFYEAAFILAPGSLIPTLDALVAAMNLVSWACAGVALLFFGLGLSRIDRIREGVVSVLLPMMALATTGVFFESGTYGHPITPALAFATAGLWLLLFPDLRPRFAWPEITSLLFGLGLMECALGLRLDVALLWPGAIATIWLRCGRARPLYPSIATAALVLLIPMHMIVVSILIRHGSDQGLAGQLLSFLGQFYRPSLLAAGIVKSVLDAGPGLVLLFLILLFAENYRLEGRRAMVLAALAWVIPPWLAYIGNPTPARHFLYLAFALAWGSGIMLTRTLIRISAREAMRRPIAHARYAAVLILLILANLASHWITGPIASHFSGRMRPEIVTRLGQSVFARHKTNQAYLDWDRRRWAAELASMPDGQVYIGAWRELGGLLLNASRANLEVRRVGFSQSAGSSVSVLWIDSKRAIFLEWYPGRRLPNPGVDWPRAVVHPYPAEAMNELKAARTNFPPPGLSFEYW